METDVRTILSIVQKDAFEKDMVSPDIGVFFPVTEAKQLEEFMDRSHPLWDARRKEFYNLLFTCLSNHQNSFTKGLLHTLFTREYMVRVKWPNSGYLFVFTLLNYYGKIKPFFFLSPRQKGPVVYKPFVAFLRVCLGRMVGKKYLQPEMVNYDFWAKMPLKFSAIKFYNKTLVI